MKKKIFSIIVVVCSIAIITLGVWLIFRPAGYIVLGVLTLIATFAVDYKD